MAYAGYDVIRALFLKPQLTFDKKLATEEGQDWKIVYARIRNRGKSLASDCYGMISLPDVEEEHVLASEEIIRVDDVAGLDEEKLGYRGPETYLLTAERFLKIDHELVCWSRVGSPLSVDIPRSGTANLVLFRYIDHGGRRQLQFPSEIGWGLMRASVSRMKLDVDITIASANASLLFGSVRFEPENGNVDISLNPAS